MVKETIISVIITAAIIIGNTWSQNYAQDKIDIAINKLNEVRNELIEKVLENSKEGEIQISKEEEEKENKIIEEIIEKWDSTHESLALYIEHDELEKVETQLAGIKSYIKTKEYGQAAAEIEKCNYILGHIKNKISLKLENIF